MIYTWGLDPVAFTIPLVDLPVRWYGVVYSLGALFALWFVPRWQKYFLEKPLEKERVESMVFGLFVAGVIGGRVFDVLWYQTAAFLENPGILFSVWEGGMSIHGGIVGGVLYGVWWARKQGVSVLTVTDLVAFPLACVLIFGRVANYINGELWGVPTDGTWGVVFPHVDEVPRHPSPLYHSGKNVVNSLVLLVVGMKYGRIRGLSTGVFLTVYGVVRTALHQFREPSAEVWGMSVGMVLSLVTLLCGVGVLWGVYLRERR